MIRPHRIGLNVPRSNATVETELPAPPARDLEIADSTQVGYTLGETTPGAPRKLALMGRSPRAVRLPAGALATRHGNRSISRPAAL
jgi:hypothetical protein